jgi:phosphoribosylamine--glycine ligase
LKILVVGGGGREHALAWAIAKSPRLSKLYCAPGNAGIAQVAECVAIGADDTAGIVAFAKQRSIDLVIVGPEGPLVAGLVDALEAAGIRAFGPSARAAMLEGSKAFMKDLFAKYGIPTAAYRRFTDYAAAAAYVHAHGAPIVVKASGLAAGKGVVVAHSVDEALAALAAIMQDRVFGASGDEVVIEEFMEGEEASFFALVDGTTALALASAQDHKTAFDNDQGPNTGGMGAYSPAPVLTPALSDDVMQRIVRPTVAAMAAEGRPYKGVLYCGLMITKDGPKVVEYNVRFGDPECQALMVRLQSDIVDLFEATIDGRLDALDVRWAPGTGLAVVMAANGYPGAYAKGSEIKGLDRAAACEGVTVFHAGTRAQDGRILADGGRVLGVAAVGGTAREAQARAYAGVDRIDWPEGFCRRDIGWRAVARETRAIKA